MKTLRWSLLPFLALGLFTTFIEGQTATPVDAPPSTGLPPFGTFDGGRIDNVNLLTGNVVIHAPLVSFPQRGQIMLDYQVFSQPPHYSVLYQPGDNFDYATIVNCALTDDQACDEPSTYISTAGGASYSMDHMFIPTNPCGGDGGGCPGNIDYEWDVAYDSTFTYHPLYTDVGTPSVSRAVDGSGYAFVHAPGTSFDQGVGTLYDSRGISYGYVTDPNTGAWSWREADPAGNTLVSDAAGFRDTIGRTIPPSTTYSTSIAGCPDLHHSNQPAVGSQMWSPPGPNGSPTTYLVCFTTVYHKTNFWGGAGYGYGTYTSYSESVGSTVEVQSVVLPNGLYWYFLYDSTDASYSSIAYGELTTVGYPLGGSTTYTFAALPPSALYSCSLLSVTSRTVNDDSGSHVWNYRTIAPDSSASYLVSVSRVITDPDLNDTVVTFAQLTPHESPCDYREARRDVYQGSYTAGNRLRSTTTVYQSAAGPWDSFYVVDQPLAVLPQTVTTIEGGQSSTRTISYDAGFSPVLQRCAGSCTPEGFTNLTSLGVQTGESIADSSGNVLQNALTTYKWQSTPSYLSINLLDLPEEKVLLDAQGSLVERVTYGYDENNGSPQGVFGNRTSLSRWLNTSSQDVGSTTVFDKNGMPVVVTDALVGTTRTTYDATGMFPSYRERPATAGQRHREWYVYDTSTGKLVSLTDENGSDAGDPAHTTLASLDDMGRVVSTKYPMVAAGQQQIHTCFSDEGGTCPKSGLPLTVTTTIAASPDPDLVRIQVFDQLGRVKQVLQSDPSGSDITDTTYDAFGRTDSVTGPYRAKSLTRLTTLFGYDALNRKKFETHPDNSTLQWSYSGFTTKTTDERGNAWSRTQDPLGRLVVAVEPGNLTTTYSYNALSNLHCVDQWESSTIGLPCTSARSRSFSYDSLSRLLTASNPETGTICYGQLSGTNCVNGYDGNGNLLHKTDARGVTTNYSYDALNRLLSKTYTNDPSGTASSCYQYDTSTISGAGGSLIGRLTNAWTQPGACPGSPGSSVQSRRSILSYDALGRVFNEQQCTRGTCGSTVTHPVTYGYDLSGNVTSHTNGIGTMTFFNCYDAADRLALVASSAVPCSAPNSIPSANLFSAPSYSPAGGLTGALLGTGLQLSRTYDNRLRISSETDTGLVVPSPVPGSATVTIPGFEQIKP